MAFFSTILISLFSTMALIPILRTAALRMHACLDIPDARKVHTEPTPKVGGLAMAVGALVPIVYFVPRGRLVDAILMGICLIVLTGVIDDLRNLGWRAKFAGQTAAALVVIFYGRVEICSLGSCVPDTLLPPPLSTFLTLLTIVGVTNAINLSDGLDGLAGGSSLLMFLCIGCLAHDSGDAAAVLLIATAMMGAVIGFLRFNTYPAAVFMGDTGSQLLGFLAVTLSIAVTQQDSAFSPFLPLLILGFPVLDTLAVFAERVASGRSPFVADKNHFHHKLIKLGLWHTEAVVAIYGITGLLVATAYFLRYHSDWLLLFLYALFAALVIGFFTVAERRGLRFHRTGYFDTVLKRRLKVLKDKDVLIHICFAPVQYGIPVLFAVAVFIPREVPGYAGACAAGFAAMVGMAWWLRHEWAAGLLRLAFYFSVPFLMRLGEVEPAVWVNGSGRRGFILCFVALVFFIFMTVKFTRRRNGFKATPMDFLILMIALMVPNLPDPRLVGVGMGGLTIKIMAMFFGFEVLLGELRGRYGKVALGVIGGLVLVAFRWAIA